MSNKLQEMRKKLLKTKPLFPAPQQKEKADIIPINTPNQSSPHSAHKDNFKSADHQNSGSQQKENLPINKVSSQSPESSSPNNHKKTKSIQNSQNVAISAPFDQPVQQKGEPEPPISNKNADLEQGEIKKSQQPVVQKQKEQPTSNLELVDKYPHISCSVDDEPKDILPPISTNLCHQKANLPIEKESKQQRKQQKIKLKELELVKEGIRNLRSAVKGLQKLQTMVAAQPALKHKVKSFLKELIKDTSIFSQQ